MKMLFFYFFLFFSVQHLITIENTYATNELGQTNSTPSNYPSSGLGVPIRYFESNSEVDRNALKEYEGLLSKFKNNPKLSQSKIALQRALAFFSKNKNGIPKKCGGDLDENISPRGEKLDEVNGIMNKNYLLMVDYTIPHPSDRFFILNKQTGEVESCPAAHGFGSNQPIDECPKEYRIECGKKGTRCRIPVETGNGLNASGVPTGNTGETSRGFFLVDSGYKSNQKTFKNGDPKSQGINALQLRGLIKNVNDRALERSVVFHRASYADKECATSAGCPAICPELFEKYKDKLDSSLMYLHTLDDEKKSQPDC